jgi:hypothetical protein
MLLRVSRWAFWLAAGLAAVALAIPTGWETGLTACAGLASALAYGLWRSGLAQVGRAETVQALMTGAAPLTRSALDEAASMIERCCADATSFEPALHSVARVLKTELGALRVTVYRVMGTDATHARLSELIEAQPGFHSAEHRVPLKRSALGQASVMLRQRIEASGGVVVLPVPAPGRGGVVALIEMTGLQIGVDADALSELLALAQTQLQWLAERAATAAHRGQACGRRPRLGKNA